MRHKRIKTGASLIFVGLIAASAIAAPAGEKPPQQDAQRDYLVSDREYVLPEVTLRDASGQPVAFRELATGPGRTVISFIFTSCAGICPMITANMARATPALDRIGADYRILLISVDPEHDTPRRLAEYAERFGTGPGIRFLTGRRDDVFRVLRSLDALYEGSNRMNHQPVTLISHAEPGLWRRIDGLIGSEVLVDQYRRLVNRRAAAG